MPSPIEGEAKRYTLYAVPFLMLLWAQVHGGFVVGIAYLIVYLITILFERRETRVERQETGNKGGGKRAKKLHATRYTLQALIIIISIIITFLNPVKWQAFGQIFLAHGGSVVHKDTLEYISPVKIIPFTMKNPGWISYWALIGLSLIAAIRLLKKRSWSRLVILSGTAVASLISMRYVYFFAPVAAAILPSVLTGFSKMSLRGAERRSNLMTGSEQAPQFQEYINKEIATPPSVARNDRKEIVKHSVEKKITGHWSQVTILALILAFTLIFTYHKVNFKGLLKSDTAYGFFPEQASEYIRSKGIPQPLFNDVTWGGFLIYRLWPEYKVFVDTRTLNIDIYRQYMNVLNWTDEGKAILDVYGIKSIITPAINPYTGEIFPLVRGLMKDDDWALIYLDGVAMIFVKKEYAAQSLPKTAIYREVFYEVMFWSPSFPNVPGYRRTMEELNNSMQNYQ